MANLVDCCKTGHVKRSFTSGIAHFRVLIYLVHPLLKWLNLMLIEGKEKSLAGHTAGFVEIDLAHLGLCVVRL